MPRTDPNLVWGIALLTKKLRIFGPKLVSCPDPSSLQMQFRSGHTDANVLSGDLLVCFLQSGSVSTEVVFDCGSTGGSRTTSSRHRNRIHISLKETNKV